jgi:hypothetical protein
MADSTPTRVNAHSDLARAKRDSLYGANERCGFLFFGDARII